MQKNSLAVLALACLILLAFAFIFASCSSSGSDDDSAGAGDDSAAGDDGDADDDSASPGDDSTDDDSAADDTADDTADDSADDDSIQVECDAAAITRQPYLVFVTKDSAKIVWLTLGLGNSLVEYGKTQDLGQVFKAHFYGNNHIATVTGLETETAYYYRVSSCGIASPIYSFRTAPNDDTPFTFAVLGDNRSFPEDYTQVMTGVANASPDLVINTGDIVQDGWDGSEYDPEFFGPAAGVFATTPIYVSIGNHESESVLFYNFLPYPNADGYYSFQWGNTFFIALNTNRPYIPGTPQYEWLKARLASSEAQGAEWRVVFAHHPPWSEGWDSPGYDGEPLMRAFIVPLFEQYHVDVYMCGHTHDYERALRNGVNYFITGGGGAALDMFQQSFPFVQVAQFRHHFVHVTVIGSTMQLDATDPDGTIFDTLSLAH